MKIYEKIKAAPLGGLTKKEITVAFLGDSVTQGCFEVYRVGENGVDTVHDYDASFAYRFRSIMNLLYPDMQVNVVNAGISGDGTENGVARNGNDILEKNPDLLVLSYGLNDCFGGKDGIGRYADNIASMVKQAKEKGIDVIYLTQNCMNTQVSPLITDPFLRTLAENFSAVQKSGVLGEYFAAGKAAAEGEGAVVLDLYPVWEKLIVSSCNVTELLSNKLNHPVREYHVYVAIKLIETIFGV